MFRIKTSLILQEILSTCRNELRYIPAAEVIDGLINKLPPYRFIRRKELLVVKEWLQGMIAPHYDIYDWAIENGKMLVISNPYIYQVRWLLYLISLHDKIGD